MNVLLCGYNGFMGREVRRLAEKAGYGFDVVCGVDIVTDDGEVPCAGGFDGEFSERFEAAAAKADCIIDFSHHSLTPALMGYAVSKGLPVVLCTTGQTQEELDAVRCASEKIPVFRSANMSLGVALLVELAKKTAASMPSAEIEIIEKHHDRKLDAPSGTALKIADEIGSVRPGTVLNCGRSGQGKRQPNEIGISSVRIGNVVGEHEVIISTGTETITLKHEAHSRALFAEGAVTAARFLAGKAPGMYDMKDMVGD